MPYKALQCQHALCNAHHLRELTYLLEEQGQAWAGDMIEVLRHASHLDNVNCADAQSPNYDSRKYQTQVRDLRYLYDAILSRAQVDNPIALSTGKRGRPKQSKATNLIGRLRYYSDDVWRFMTQANVPFTNNLAEQAVRSPKVKQKVSAALKRTKELRPTASSAPMPPCTSKGTISLSPLSPPSRARRLQPWHANIGKRLVKSPKVYVRDSGLVHALLDIEVKETLLSHPVVGASWEGFVIENLLGSAPANVQAYFYRTSGGAEIDLLLAWPSGELWAIEIKRSLTPKVERGFHAACEDLSPARKLVVYPGQESFPLGQGVQSVPLAALCQEIAVREIP